MRASGLKLSLLAMLLWVCPAVPQRQARGILSWSPDLPIKRLADITHALREPVRDGSKELKVRFSKPGWATRTISTCTEYFSADRDGFAPENNYENKRSAGFVDCYVLRDLMHAGPAVSHVAYQWTKDALAQLPPMMVVGAKDRTRDAEQKERQGVSWQAYDPELKLNEIKGDLLLAEDDDSYYSLEILARGDFRGDGVEDIAVVAGCTGKQSTWADAQYFIFSTKDKGKLVRMTDNVPPYLELLPL